MIKFDEEKHEYKSNGVIVPSVTQVIQSAGLVNFDFVDPELLAQKADIGRKVHKACQMYDEGTLDEEMLHPLLAGYLEGWKRFRTKFNYVPQEHEGQLYSPVLNVAGTFDSLSITEGKLVDIKTGCKSKAHRVQIEGYAYLIAETRSIKAKEKMVVYLTNKGGYKVDKWKVDQGSLIVFLACVTLSNFKRG
ncbi:MAG: hypothetical protein WC623_24025 [Pedobacter sp.]|uniref:hypothetical protein n=1 Tax=Pedobacter sp. TaxID=1411316 RepID=UPI003564469D